MGKYILSLDQGTTSSRAILFDSEQNIVALAQKEFNQYYPRSGWVEHNPMEIYSSQYAVMMEAVTESGIDVADIAAIGITNQRETTIVWDRQSGEAVSRAIVWQCRRTSEFTEELKNSDPGIVDLFRGHIRRKGDRLFGHGGVFRLPDQCADARKVAEQNGKAEQRDEYDEPPAVEHVVKPEGEDERRRPLGIRIAVLRKLFALRDQTSDHACDGDRDQKDDRERHRGDKLVDFFQDLHAILRNAAKEFADALLCRTTDRWDYPAFGFRSAIPSLMSCSAVSRQRVASSELCAPSEFST